MPHYEHPMRTNLSHFSHVIAAVQRTGSLPGGEVRGLPGGRAVGGLLGIESLALEVAEAQKEFQQGRPRLSHKRVKQLEVKFNGIAGRWDSSVGALIADVRQGKQLKNLEKLKELKAAQIRMQQLVIPARKAIQDLIAVLDSDAVNQYRKLHETDRSSEMAKQDGDADQGSDSREGADPGGARPERTPGQFALGAFASNYRYGSKLQFTREPTATEGVVPAFQAGSFYMVAGWEPPRVVRVREVMPDGILVFDTSRAREAMITTDQVRGLVEKGVWVLSVMASREDEM